MPIEKSNQLYCKTRAAWRRWLAKNHAKSVGVWFVYFKKHTRKPSVSYNDAVEEALCFGWIDSTVKRLDDERYIQQFTPRRNANNWSESNKARVRRLIAAKLMSEAGYSKIDLKILDEKPKPRPKPSEIRIPKFIETALKRDKIAWKNFQNLAPSYRKFYIYWLSAAKREETRARRIAFALELLRQNKKLSTG